MTDPLLRRVDAVTVPVPDLDQGLRFYGTALGHEMIWRDDTIGQAGLRLPDGDSELVLTLHQAYEPAWLVESAADAARVVAEAGGRVLEGPVDIPVGALAVVADPFGNRLVLLDLHKGTYVPDADGHVAGVSPPPGPPTAP